MSGYQSGNMAGEMWVQWFSCCVNQPAAQRVSHHAICTASFCAVDCHDKLYFTDHCFNFATTFIAVSFFVLVLLLVPFLLCVFGTFIPVFTSKFCF